MDRRSPPPRRRLTRRQRRRRARLRGLAALCVLVTLGVLAGLALSRAVGGGAQRGASTRTHTPGAHASTGVTASASTGTAGATSSAAASPAPARVIAGGDVMTDRGVKSYALRYGPDAVLQGIAPVLQTGDAAFVNVEGPLSRRGSPVPGKDYTFEGMPAMAGALADAGVDVATLANNHAVDYGPTALMDTIRNLEKAGIKVVGAGRDYDAAHTPAIIRTDSGATIGFLGYSDVLWPGFGATATQPGVAEASPDVARMKADIRALARRVDYVVVMFHWGIEYTHYPIGQQVSEAHAAVDAGADLVIGAHPHVLQGFATYKGRLIAYSLGDLVFDHYSVETGQTVLVDARLIPHGVTATLVPVYVSSGGEPAVQHGAAGATILRLVKSYSVALGTHVSIKGDTATVRAGAPR